MSPFARRLLVAAVTTPLGVGALWIGAMGVRPGTLGTNPVVCNVNDRCVIEARTERDGWFGCVVTSDYNQISVGNGFKPRLVWKVTLVDPKDTSDYWFDTDGITLDPADQNDPATDLYESGYEPEGRTHFRWRDRNGRPKNIHFDLKVRRSTGVFIYPSVACKAKDPLIANAGN